MVSYPWSDAFVVAECRGISMDVSLSTLPSRYVIGYPHSTLKVYDSNPNDRELNVVLVNEGQDLKSMFGTDI